MIYYRNKHTKSDSLRTNLGQLTSYEHSGANKTGVQAELGFQLG